MHGHLPEWEAWHYFFLCLSDLCFFLSFLPECLLLEHFCSSSCCWYFWSMASSSGWQWQVPSLWCISCSISSHVSSSVSLAADVSASLGVSQVVSCPATSYFCVSSFSLSSRRWKMLLSCGWGMVSPSAHLPQGPCTSSYVC